MGIFLTPLRPHRQRTTGGTTVRSDRTGLPLRAERHSAATGVADGGRRLLMSLQVGFLVWQIVIKVSK
ncbi:MAG: hypothetical protein IJ256_06560 [Bacteroidaceae bacterium]|nr:hypothetical protein [Bacteroidaceae bacterium]